MAKKRQKDESDPQSVQDSAGDTNVGDEAETPPAPPSPDPMPTIEQLLQEGYEEREAHGMLAGIAANIGGKSSEECDAAYEQAVAEYDAAQEAQAKAKSPEPPPPTPSPEAPPTASPAKPDAKAKRPFYRVVATSRKGRFYRIGKGFTRTPTDIFVDQLTEAQVHELETSNPNFLSVTLMQG